MLRSAVSNLLKILSSIVIAIGCAWVVNKLSYAFLGTDYMVEHVGTYFR